MTTVEILRAARGLIANPDRWTQGPPAIGPDGRSIPPGDPNAQCWCSGGALLRYGDDHHWGQEKYGGVTSPALEALHHAAEELGSGSALVVNEYTDHATVLRMFDLAIERALSERDEVGRGVPEHPASEASAEAARHQLGIGRAASRSTRSESAIPAPDLAETAA